MRELVDKGAVSVAFDGCKPVSLIVFFAIDGGVGVNGDGGKGFHAIGDSHNACKVDSFALRSCFKCGLKLCGVHGDGGVHRVFLW